MADPRFYDNRGPHRLGHLCAGADLDIPAGADPDAFVFDVAGLSQAGAQHLAFFEGHRAKADFLGTKAGWCLVGAKAAALLTQGDTVLIRCAAVGRAFGTIGRAFYPGHEMEVREQPSAVHASASIGRNAVLAPGVVVGPHAEIGENSAIGANTVIGRGVTIGRDCRIGTNVSIAFAHLGDEVLIQPGAVVGGSGFGFSSAADGHVKMPHLGRVMIQDRVEIGANSTIDRGALGDTVIGEGTKIDNLVQIGHNTVIGRHCILAGMIGISGSVVVGDFVLMGGKVGISDHVTIGDRVRLAALSGVGYDLEGGRDYGGVPARPVREWQREMAAVAKLGKRKLTPDG